MTVSAAHARELLAQRLVVSGDTPDSRLASLEAFLAEVDAPEAIAGEALKPKEKIGFVFFRQRFPVGRHGPGSLPERRNLPSRVRAGSTRSSWASAAGRF
ncbi:hypothetical protein [uncultured Roseibium sp.]|uniref:hypothetical protein n=1 Tax=uncultured Roseibium sp. TaxID=1936171 RepID=UPI003216B2FD